MRDKTRGVSLGRWLDGINFMEVTSRSSISCRNCSSDQGFVGRLAVLAWIDVVEEKGGTGTIAGAGTKLLWIIDDGMFNGVKRQLGGWWRWQTSKRLSCPGSAFLLPVITVRKLLPNTPTLVPFLSNEQMKISSRNKQCRIRFVFRVPSINDFDQCRY